MRGLSTPTDPSHSGDCQCTPKGLGVLMTITHPGRGQGTAVTWGWGLGTIVTQGRSQGTAVTWGWGQGTAVTRGQGQGTAVIQGQGQGTEVTWAGSEHHSHPGGGVRAPQSPGGMVGAPKCPGQGQGTTVTQRWGQGTAVTRGRGQGTAVTQGSHKKEPCAFHCPLFIVPASGLFTSPLFLCALASWTFAPLLCVPRCK